MKLLHLHRFAQSVDRERERMHMQMLAQAKPNCQTADKCNKNPNAKVKIVKRGKILRTLNSLNPLVIAISRCNIVTLKDNSRKLDRSQFI